MATERLAFAGDHFGDVAAVQDHAAHELHVVMAQPEHAATRLAADGERLDQQVVERLALGQTPAELVGLLAQLRRTHLLVLRLQRVDGVDPRLELLQIPGVGRAEQRGHPPLDPAAQPGEGVRNNLPGTFQGVHGNTTNMG